MSERERDEREEEYQSAFPDHGEGQLGEPVESDRDRDSDRENEERRDEEAA